MLSQDQVRAVLNDEQELTIKFENDFITQNALIDAHMMNCQLWIFKSKFGYCVTVGIYEYFTVI